MMWEVRGKRPINKRLAALMMGCLWAGLVWADEPGRGVLTSFSPGQVHVTAFTGVSNTGVGLSVFAGPRLAVEAGLNRGMFIASKMSRKERGGSAIRRLLQRLGIVDPLWGGWGEWAAVVPSDGAWVGVNYFVPLRGRWHGQVGGGWHWRKVLYYQSVRGPIIVDPSHPPPQFPPPVIWWSEGYVQGWVFRVGVRYDVWPGRGYAFAYGGGYLHTLMFGWNPYGGRAFYGSAQPLGPWVWIGVSYRIGTLKYVD